MQLICSFPLFLSFPYLEGDGLIGFLDALVAIMLALEKAGSLFTGWIRSCLTCLPGEDGSQPREEGKGMCAIHIKSLEMVD